jgi:xanthine dehydrogenase YagR molybdenum-binding subunit
MSTSVIGQAITRIDAKKKVTGAARYAVDHPKHELQVNELVYAVGVPSTIANGKVLRIDSSRAESVPGFLALIHHDNLEYQLYRSANNIEAQSHPGESRAPFEDNVVYYYGQFVAMVVAKSFEQAQDAASKVRVEYEVHEPSILLKQNEQFDHPPVHQYSRGDADAAFVSAPVKLDETYTTPPETHNPMEMHATIAVWRGEKLTLYETTQGVVNHHNTLAQVLGLPPEDLQVISPFVGSGFGGKLFPWPHSAMAAVAAKKVGRPVKITVPRTLMFTTVGHRPNSHQRIRIGATQEGKLLSLRHDVVQPSSMVDDYVENIIEPTPILYSCPNVTAIQNLVHRNIGTPSPMRGPGTCPGLFALESALDELAFKLNIDPLEIRLRNYAEKDESTNLPFSSKHLRECYEVGAERFGWSKRNAKIGSMRNGNLILGMGMGTCTWPAGRGSAEVRVRLMADGTARVSSATQDIGTGTYTIMAQVVSEKTGISVEKIDVVLGDSSLPPGPTSGGSTATATVLPAVSQATKAAIQELIQVVVRSDKSPFQNADARTLTVSEGRIHKRDESPSSGISISDALALRRLSALDGYGRTQGDQDKKNYSFHTFGVHFGEVSYDPGIAKLRITRWVTVMDAGKVINKKTATNQIVGGVVMGIGMGLFEETLYNPKNGHPLNNNFADYMVTVNADTPPIEVIFLNYPDTKLNEFGARGVGEIGLTGVASALASAVYHAIGVRVRDLPIRIEDLLPATVV